MAELTPPAKTPEPKQQYVPLTCHGHTRPVPHFCFSPIEKDGQYYMISACKDGNPMLRDGLTGDWIGTFIGHKGAVWQARLSPDINNAATASADFTAKIWNTHTGEVLYTIQHDHIVRAVAYPPDNNDLIATGGHEKKLRIFDLSKYTPASEGDPVVIPASEGHEIGEGVHKGAIKIVVWTNNPNIIVTASDKTLRWFDIPSQQVIREEVLDGEIKTCELVSLSPDYRSPYDIGGGWPVLAVSAGRWVYFWGGANAMDELKRMDMKHGIAGLGVDLKGRKIVVGEEPGTWGKVCNWEDGSAIETHKGHHGPIWSVVFSPDNKLYATGSEDGTIKMWKNCEGSYGLWRVGEAGDKTAAAE
ncbi:serine-threonine kinase receptor-associated protein [Plectosphaerella plurivora]|uniref:Serine-threonine kinase receptor-associated protein n=1 Tax=Plectosphaerella plurivora TaxID=936078 RepID=A0A9P8VPH1_9PEZI|nr:serine-threonine kinase receptor-associated protein [Plectosphaerella plurivora]